MVVAIHNIPGADFIRQATVVCGSAGKWSGVVGLDVLPASRVLVFLQDAVLPPDPRWAFMEKHKWRVRMARFKGVPSECVIINIPTDPVDELQFDAPIGTDFSEKLGVTKFTKPIPASMQGVAKGNFPSFIPKTDEPNFQTVDDLEDKIANLAMVARIKYDGSSCTAWNDITTGALRVASRNLELEEFIPTGGTNAYWKTARKYDLSKLPEGCALQFEVIGPSIQGNPLGLADVEGRAFTLYDFVNHCRRSDQDLIDACIATGVPIAHAQFTIEPGCYLDADQLRRMAEITYPNGRHGEGLVFRSLDHTLSFKTINLLYKERD
jgi:RNA ligase (TIGR02306 family)